MMMPGPESIYTPVQKSGATSLGVAWCAINPQIDLIAPRLKARLRRQCFLITASIVAGFPLVAAGMVLALFTIWHGWVTGTWNLVIRGVAIVAMSMILLFAVLRQLPVRASDAARALPEMIELSIMRAQRTLRVIQLGFYACAVAAAFGLVGTAIRMSLTKPPRMSPVVDLAVLMAFALGLFFHRRNVKVHLEKMRALNHALAMDGGT